MLQNPSPDHGTFPGHCRCMLSSTWASARSMERSTHDKLAHCRARNASESIVQRQHAVNRPTSSDSLSACTLQSPVKASFGCCSPSADRLCRAWTAESARRPRRESLAEQTATFTHTQSGLRAGESEGLLQSDRLSANSGRRLITFPECRAWTGGSAALKGPGSLLLAGQPAR